MLEQELALALRPKQIGQMIGLEKLAAKLQRRWERGRFPQATMFIGETGAGKTTLARILAVSMQCTHQESFGNPCKKCYKHMQQFDITEINCADITGVDGVRQALEGSDYVPRPGSAYRVYILDEAHMLSKHAQNLCLKYLEDCPKSTFWFINTTRPDAILDTLVGRCTIRNVPSLSLEGVTSLVRRGLKKLGSENAIDPLAEALYEKGVTSPRKILKAVQKYDEGDTAEEAALVGAAASVDTYVICRNVIKARWSVVAKQLRDAKPEDALAIRSSVAAYLSAMLVDEEDFSSRASKVAKSIIDLTSVSGTDAAQLAATKAILYFTCRDFKQYKR